MMSPPVKLTEQFLLTLTNCDSLADIKVLDISENDLTNIPADLFKKLTNLERLDLSNNDIHHFPNDLSLDKLKVLDLSLNDLTDLDFVQQFSNLEELYVENNTKLDPGDKFIVTAQCPNLACINGRNYVKIVQKIQEKMLADILGKWRASYQSDYPSSIPPNKYQTVKDAIVESFITSKAFPEVTEAKFRQFMLERCVEQFLQTVHSGEPVANKRVRKVPSKFLEESPVRGKRGLDRDEETVTPQPKKRRVEEEKKKRRSSVDLDPPESSDEDEHEVMKIVSFDHQPVFELPPAPDYDPIGCYRCHSKNNKPSDCLTKVWCCAFEPSLDGKDGGSGVVATCGGDSVCFIDCNTGIVMKKYKEANETFYALAWTVLPVGADSNKKNRAVLAAAGTSKIIRLILPDQLICYATLEGHNKSIPSLRFHPTEKNILFSSSDDLKIIQWDIGTPKGPEYEVKTSKLCVFDCAGELPEILVLPTQKYLLGAGYGGCYCWPLKKESKKSKISPSHHLIHSDSKVSQDVDSLCHVSGTIVASKGVKLGCIYLWDFGKNVLDRKPREKAYEIAPHACLKWQDTEEEYIFCRAARGLLVCGDMNGSIWMYNVDKLIKNKSFCPNLCLPSVVILWPDYSFEDEKAEKMTDLRVPTPREPIINTVTLSPDAKFMVAATDNNLICLWGRAKR